MIDLTRTPPELFACALEANLRRLGPLRKVHGHFLDAVALRFGAGCAWLRLGARGEEGRVVAGDPALEDGELARAFLADEYPEVPPGTLLERVRVQGRRVAALGVVRPGRPFDRGERRALDRLAEVLAGELARREEERQTRVLNRIREKLASELRPLDLAYQILDGLYQLVEYDHSAAFLTYDPAAGTLRIEAEKIVWAKAKSASVGREVPVSEAEVEALSRGPAVREIAGGAAPGDAFEALDYHRGQGAPPVGGLLTAPLFFGEVFLGLLKIAAWRRRPFDAGDLVVVERFLPAAAVSLRNARLNMSLEQQAMQAELKATLVTLARAVAHDVNNAVGGILPLAQQMRADLEAGPVDPATLDRDLAAIVDNARLCQRIFTNMLRVGGAARTAEGPVDLGPSVAEVLPFVQGRAARQGVAVALEVGSDLPAVRCSRQDLQHIVLNLVTNSLEALAEGGGRIAISAHREPDGGVALAVADDGPGIEAELLGKVQEPFFSTKRGGTGLGLSICRALAWQNGGSFDIRSAVGEGTRVTVGLRAEDLGPAGPAGEEG